MSENKLTLHAFADWARSKGNESYEYHDSSSCACAQYHRELGMNYNIPNVGMNEFPAHSSFFHQIEYLAANAPSNERGYISFADLATYVEAHINEQ